jgi:glyoxylase-like metal-dependent hydrolase (beta-lactamase superfamily II)
MFPRILTRAYGRRLAVHMVRNGAGTMHPVVDVTPFDDGDELDVPGPLRVLHTPGHSDGECVLMAPHEDALFVGDPLTNRNALTGEPGPRVTHPSGTTSTDQAYASLARIE